jgi:hypothetical protein
MIDAEWQTYSRQWLSSGLISHQPTHGDRWQPSEEIIDIYLTLGKRKKKGEQSSI